MKVAFVFLLAFYHVECRKVYAPIDKNANIAFINMEGGGGGMKPGNNARPAAPTQNTKPANVAQAAPVPIQTPPPKPASVPAKPASVPAKPVATSVLPNTPAKSPTAVTPPNQIKPVPVNPAPVAKPMSTPGPGTVKQLVNFYDSQGKGSPIRPYSYSQAVKQG